MPAPSRIQPHFSATYYSELVEELALVMKKFLEAGMTSTEAQSATQAYAEMRSAMMRSSSEAYQRTRDREASASRARDLRHEKGIRW